MSAPSPLPEGMLRVGPLAVDLRWHTSAPVTPGVDVSLRLSPESRLAPRVPGVMLGWDAELRHFEAGGCRLDQPSTGVVEGRTLDTPPARARALRFATQPFLRTRGWLLLHGSSVVVRGQTHVFVAPSGTGKSTLARTLSDRGHRVLGDEVALVGLDVNGTVVSAVHPGQLWFDAAGVDLRAEPTPLAAIHLLGRSDAPRSTPLAPSAALALLLRQVMCYEAPSAAAASILSILSRLVEATPWVGSTDVPLGHAAARWIEAWPPTGSSDGD